MTALKELISTITTDLLTPISYIPYGILIAFFYVGIVKLLERLGFIKKHISNHKIIMNFGFITYIIVMIITALLSREAGSRTGINLSIFSILCVSTGENASFIENIIMFFPMGLFLTERSAIFKKTGYLTMFSISLSIFLELLQLITQRGYCQIDDVITNTIGAVLGHLTFMMIYKLYKNKKKKLYPVKNISALPVRI
ncbi:MAG: VanZ family protein [Butyrivibrio sp.]|nr:VanZ family protein [Butyrivibrio sp.]